MANILKLFDDYSSEDYLCHKLKPHDFIKYVCPHCNCDIREEDLGLPYCFECGEIVWPVERA